MTDLLPILKLGITINFEAREDLQETLERPIATDGPRFPAVSIARGIRELKTMMTQVARRVGARIAMINAGQVFA
ncbi:MAG: hypothetical protein ACSLE1_12375 [Sphingobium sp.]